MLNVIDRVERTYVSLTSGFGLDGLAGVEGEEEESKDPVFLWPPSDTTVTLNSLGNEPDLLTTKGDFIIQHSSILTCVYNQGRQPKEIYHRTFIYPYICIQPGETIKGDL